MVSEITCVIKFDTDDKQTDRQTDRQDRRTDEGKREITFSHSRDHETSRIHESGKSPYGLDYYTSLAYAREVKNQRKLTIETSDGRQNGNNM